MTAIVCLKGPISGTFFVTCWAYYLFSQPPLQFVPSCMRMRFNVKRAWPSINGHIAGLPTATRVLTLVILIQAGLSFNFLWTFPFLAENSQYMFFPWFQIQVRDLIEQLMHSQSRSGGCNTTSMITCSVAVIIMTDLMVRCRRPVVFRSLSRCPIDINLLAGAFYPPPKMAWHPEHDEVAKPSKKRTRRKCRIVSPVPTGNFSNGVCLISPYTLRSL